MLTIQYLEDSPEIDAIAPEEAGAHLRAAFDRLPLDVVIVGWRLPAALFHTCAREAARAGARLYRWHPLLTGDAIFRPRPEWRVIGLDGRPVPGFRGLPELTFLCPNRPAVREAALAHLWRAIHARGYQGVFLDRIRYPSPAADPRRLLACFCQDCRAAAAAQGLDLPAVREEIWALPPQTLAQALLDRQTAAPDGVRAFLEFRAQSVTRFVHAAAALARAEGLEVGLDCFSPALTWMVGQDLSALDPCADWTKLMTYGHTLGPAGLPFELLELAGWLAEQGAMGEPEALQCLARAAGLLLPATRSALAEDGLPPGGLAGEIRRARAAGVRTPLAGLELVRLAGVTHLSEPQIAADLQAFRSAGAAGLALSWDLRHMPLEWLELVAWRWKG
jgi:hypothetical protein